MTYPHDRRQLLPNDRTPAAELIHDVARYVAELAHFKVETRDPETLQPLPERLRHYGDQLLDLGRRCHEIANQLDPDTATDTEGNAS